MFGKLLVTGLSPMVYIIWGLLDSDIFNLLTCVHVIWNRFCVIWSIIKGVQPLTTVNLLAVDRL